MRTISFATPWTTSHNHTLKYAHTRSRHARRPFRVWMRFWPHGCHFHLELWPYVEQPRAHSHTCSHNAECRGDPGRAGHGGQGEGSQTCRDGRPTTKPTVVLVSHRTSSCLQTPVTCSSWPEEDASSACASDALTSFGQCNALLASLVCNSSLTRDPHRFIAS